MASIIFYMSLWRSFGAFFIYMLNVSRRLFLVTFSAAALCQGADSSPPKVKWVAEQYARKVIYHSPQTPGYTPWAGAWIMPDQSMMITFTQDTGPLTGRPRTTKEAIKKFYIDLWTPDRDATALVKQNLFFRSTDEGATWTPAGSWSWEGPMCYISPGGQEVVLKNGTILKSVFGYYQPFEDVPQGAYIMRSTNYAKTWEKPIVVGDPDQEVFRFTRMRLLSDGRVIGTGGRARTPWTTKDVDIWDLWEPLLVASSDSGMTWSKPVEFLTPEQRATWKCEEWDSAELTNGDLLCVFRRFDPARPTIQVRWQGLLKKTGPTWVMQGLGPSVLRHSGHPELLVTKEGVILYISTEGVYSTTDGTAWDKVEFPEVPKGYRSRYYPKSVQSQDGKIFVFSHVGTDNNYGTIDQEIVMDTFRLKQETPP